MSSQKVRSSWASTAWWLGRFTFSDWLLVVLTTIVLVILGLFIGRWIDSGVAAEIRYGLNYQLLAVVDLGLLFLAAITAAAWALTRLGKGLMIVVSVGLVWLVSFWGWSGIETIGRAIFTPNIYTQLLVMLLSLGLLGVLGCLWELSKNWGVASTRYWPFLARHGHWPSFTSMGSLLLASLIKLVRDQTLMSLFIFSLASLLILSATNATALLTGFFLSSGALSLVATNRLTEWAQKLGNEGAYLPLSLGAINFNATFAGLVFMALWGWSATMLLSPALPISNISAVLAVATGLTISLLLAQLFALARWGGALKRWWLVLTQALTLAIFYPAIISTNQTIVTAVLAVGLVSLVVIATYQVRPRLATITSA